MAKKISQIETPENPARFRSNRVMVKALVPMMKVRWAYPQGAEFEVADALAEQWVELGYVEIIR